MIDHDTAATPDLISGPATSPAASFASSASGIWIEIFTDMPSIGAAWRSFEHEAECTVFQRYDYLAAWQRNIGNRKGTRPVVVFFRGQAEEMLAILPLAITRSGNCHRLSWLGQDNSDYCGPLLSPGFGSRIDARTFSIVWKEILQSISTTANLSFDIVDLRKMPSCVGKEPNPFSALPILPNPSNAHLTKIWGDWEKFYAEKRSSATRRRDRTKRKRLAEFGNVRMADALNPEEITATFEKLIEQKSAALLSMGVANLFAEPGVRDFYLDLATGDRTSGFTHVSKLMVGDCQASTNLGFEHRGRYYYVLASYDAGEVSRFGPGAAHLRDLMQRAIERGLTEFDFTIGDERYKSEWSDTETLLYDHISARSLRGMPVVALERTNKRLRRLIKQNAWLWGAVLKVRAAIGSHTASAKTSETDNK